MASPSRGRAFSCDARKRISAAEAIRAAALEALEARLLLAYVNVNTEQPAQTIAGIGGNYAAGRYTGGGTVNDNVGTYTLNNLSPAHARIGIPLLDWEATNDDANANNFNWPGFKQTGGPLNVMLLMQDLKNRGIPITASVWDAPNWMITAATQPSSQQRIVDPTKYSEFVESIAAYLVKARDTYGVTVDAISVNESDGGYRLKFTSAEMIDLIKIAGPRFQALGLNPTWLVGDTTTPSALVSYATPILQDPTASQYIGAIAYHSWGAFNYADSVFQGIANLGAQYNKPVWCEELGYDSQLYLTPSTFQTWTYATKLAQTYQKVLKLSKATVADYWEYQNDYGLTSNSSATSPTLYPAYYLVKQLADNLKPGAQIVSATSDSSTIQAMAARTTSTDKFFLQLINTSTSAQDVTINGLPSSAMTLIRSSSSQNNVTIGNYNPVNGTLTFTLPADSVNNFTGRLSVPAPWSERDIGSGIAGASTFAGGTFTVKGSGSGLAGSSDGFRMISQDIDGDGSIIARVDPSAIGAAGEAGVMIRESAGNGSTFASLMVNAAGVASFRTRGASNANSTSTTTSPSAPYFLKLARSGNTITASTSINGTSWTVVGSNDIPMGAGTQIGLAATSGNNAALGTATFTQIQVIANAPLTAPGKLVAAAPTDTRVDLTWADNTGNESGFYVERSNNGANGWTQIAAVASPNASGYSDTSVVGNSQYFYRIRAFNSVGTSPYSAMTNIRTPSPVYEAELAPTQSGVRTDTTWSGYTGAGFIDFVTTNGAFIEFNVNMPTAGPWAMDFRYGLGVGSPLRPLNISIDGVQVATGVSFPSASNWTTWMTYSQYANLSAGNHLIRLTDTGSDGPNIDNLRVRPTAPPSPAAFTAKASAGKMNLTWTDVPVEDGYRIERSTDGATFSLATTLAPNVVSWQDPNAVVGTSYTYRLTPFNSVGDATPKQSTATIPTIPTAPTSLIATNITTTQIDIAWNDNSGNEDVFRVEQSTDGVNFTQITATVANVKTYSATGLTPGQAYWFRVRTTNGGGDSAFTNTLATAAKNLAPASLTATTGSITQINLSWPDVSGETSYRIERSPDGVNNWTQAGTTAANITTFPDSGLSAGTAYFYRVTAINLGGASAATSNATASTTPAAPQLATPTAASSTQIDLAWSTVTGATQYLVETSPNGTNNWTTAGTSVTAAFSHINLTPGTQYFYRVKAIGAGGTSAASNVANTTTLGVAAPATLTATTVSASQIKLSWPDITGETQYLIQGSPDGINNWTQIGATAQNITTFNHTPLAAATQYFYRIVVSANGVQTDPGPVASATTAPLAPASPLASTFSTSQINVTWAAVTGATQYTIERSLNGTSGWALAGNAPAIATSFNDIGLAPGTAYFYHVIAQGVGGPSAPSINATASTIPAAPGTLGALPSSPTQINLTWLDVTGETQYLIERSANGIDGWLQVGTSGANVLTFSNINLSPGATWFYQVKAVGAGGTSAPSNVASATTPLVPLAAPASLTATTISVSQINLSWPDVANEAGYSIERSANGTTGWAQVGTTGASITTFSNTALASGTAYFYRVISTAPGQTSAPSPTASASTIPAPPTSLTATPISSTQINLNWPDVVGETQYLIERSPNGTGSWAQVGTAGANVLTFSNTALTAGTTYYYRVKAVGVGGTSAPGVTASTTTLTTGLPAPTLFVATVASPTLINLTWTDNATIETNYSVERSNNGTTWSVVATLAANTTSYPNAVSAKKTYYYRVRATQGATTSAYATALPVTTPGSGGQTIGGTVFLDSNSNGLKEANEAALVNWVVYIDSNNNGVRDATEPSIATSSLGAYLFGNLSATTYQVRLMQPTGYVYTLPATGVNVVTLAKKQSASNINFGNKASGAGITAVAPVILPVDGPIASGLFGGSLELPADAFNRES